MPEVLPIVKVEGRLGLLTDMRSCEAEGMEKMRQEDAVSGARVIPGEGWMEGSSDTLIDE